MNVDSLIPLPLNKEAFNFSRTKYVPETAGCYLLSTFAGHILYIGLARNLRRRMAEHLSNSGKTKKTTEGSAIYFHWYEHADINKVERTWMNIHLAQEGVLPLMNKIYSPTSV